MEIKRPIAERAGQKLGWAKGTAVYGAKGFLFLSGVVGRDPETDAYLPGMPAQTKCALEIIKERLEELGTSLENTCQIQIFVVGQFPEGIITDQGWLETWRVMQDFWKEHCPQFVEGVEPPTMTLIGVTALAGAEALVEIQVIAAIP